MPYTKPEYLQKLIDFWDRKDTAGFYELVDLVEEIIYPKGLPKKLHPIQEKILYYKEKIKSGELGYRKIGKLIGITHPQQVKHHYMELQKKGLI